MTGTNTLKRAVPARGIRRVSLKRAKLNREYSKLKAEFIKLHPYCQWFIAQHGMDELKVKFDFGCANWLVVPRSVDIHHVKGRGKYLLDTSTWMAVSRYGHEWIHNHPKESYQRGYMQPRR